MKASRKELIIASATKRFAHFGFSKTTMHEIAEDLHITKANLYYYYPDKLSLMKDVILSISEKVHLHEKEIIGEGGSVLAIISKILSHRRDMNIKYSMLQLTENLEMIKGLEMQDVMQVTNARDESAIEQILSTGIAVGELQNIDVKDVARTLLDVISGLNFLCNIADILKGLPNPNNASLILEKQMKATVLIYNGIKN